jgi:Mce-associated membrane protein
VPEPAAEAKPAGAEAPQGRTSRPRRLLAPLVGVGVAAALLAGSAGLALSDPSGQEAQTRAATAAARTSIEQMLSYN